MTPEKELELFESLGRIEANQESYQKKCDEREKKNEEDHKTFYSRTNKHSILLAVGSLIITAASTAGFLWVRGKLSGV